jgi:CrcB protein
VTEALLWAGVLALGGAGAIFRTAIAAGVDEHKWTPFPLGTFVVNISGALLAGLLYGAGLDGDPGLLASTALIGAYTTFSTWIGDSERLLGEGRVEVALLNLFGSLLAGFGIAFGGKAVGTALF